MKLKKYLVLNHTHVVDPFSTGSNDIYDSLKPKVVEGFTRDLMKEALDVQTGWKALGNGQDKLYFLPGCSVPRFKVRETYSCTIKPEHATAAFVSKTNLLGSDTTLDLYPNLCPVDAEDLKSFIADMYDQKASKLIFSLINSYKYEKIFLSKILWKERTYSNRICNNHRICDVMETGRYSWLDRSIEAANNLLGYKRNNALAKSTAPIYFEDELLSVLNKDNFVIDNEKYEELRAFGLTKDKENEVLMMELMSNCDFEKSIVSLLFLLKEFGSNIKNYKEANHVNFKSLLSFLNINQSKIPELDLITMTRILREHKKFTRANAMTLSSLFANDYINYNDNNNLCWVQGPVLNPDCQSLLNKEETDA
jgi:hypothetical protein